LRKIDVQKVLFGNSYPGAKILLGGILEEIYTQKIFF
tara:strand:- start:8445 stop:8555 length:111 start_codon:yes stop_codon:yes gene_type:complete